MTEVGETLATTIDEIKRIQAGIGEVTGSIFRLQIYRDYPSIDDTYLELKSRQIGSTFILGHPINGKIGSQSALQPYLGVERVAGFCIEFDGVDDHIRIPDNNTLDLASMSIEMWINTIAFAELVTVPLFKGRTDAQANYGFFVFNDGSLQFNVYTNTGESICSTPTGTVGTGSWLHLVGLYESGTIHQIYVNNSRVGSKTPLGIPTGNTGSLWIASEHAGGAFIREFNGKIDEIRIWNKILTTGSIATLYNAGSGLSGGSEAALVAGYHLDVSGGTVTDYSGNNNGSILGGPSWVTRVIGTWIGEWLSQLSYSGTTAP